jgi:hypothetical protein
VSKHLSRRQILQTSLGAAAVAGLGLGGVAQGMPAAATSPHEPLNDPVPAAHPEPHPEPGFPSVPGMLGDRRENEFWYQFDEAVGYNPTNELIAAYAAIETYLGGNLFSVLWRKWLDMVRAGAEYPANFTSFVTPVAEPLAVISQAQLTVFDAFYRRNDPRLVKLFADFGQGVLYDPRRAAAGAAVHTIDGNPPSAYHVWHVCLRAMMLLGVDRSRWCEFSPLVGFSWVLQSVAKPNQQAVNPPLPRRTVRRLATSWLSRTPERLDIDFQSFPYPPGIT